MEQTEQKNAENPRQRAGIVSVLTFWYTIELFKKGYNQVLKIEDLFRPLKVDESGSLGDRLEKWVCSWLIRKLQKDKKSRVISVQ